MKDTWFTSDTHFGHANILEYEKDARQFASIEDMNEALVERWNSVVKPDDVVYHLGDFCMGRKNIAFAGRLNGKKKLVLGNHDNFDSAEYLQYFDQLFGVIFWKHKILLSHMPVLKDEERWVMNAHGHLHSDNVQLVEFQNTEGGLVEVTVNNPRYFNVSTEQNNLTPFHSDELIARLEIIAALDSE